MTPGDAELLQRWRDGDLEAGEALFDRYYEMVERFFINKVTDGVDDLVQETFIACVESRDRLQDAQKFRSYLFTVAHNILYRHFRRSSRYGGEIDFETVSVYELSPSPSSVIVRRSEERLLLEGLRHIPVGYQILLELHYWEHMKTADIATVLGMPVGTVRSRMRRARELLEDAMAELETSRAILESTKSCLEDWAQQCRLLLGPRTAP